MVKTEMLNERIKDSGLKRQYIAEKLGITPLWFTKKIRNEATFTVTEAAALCELLGIRSDADKAKIFLNNE